MLTKYQQDVFVSSCVVDIYLLKHWILTAFQTLYAQLFYAVSINDICNKIKIHLWSVSVLLPIENRFLNRQDFSYIFKLCQNQSI